MDEVALGASASRPQTVMNYRIFRDFHSPCERLVMREGEGGFVEYVSLVDLRMQVFDCLPMPIVLMDVSTHRFIDGNPAALAIYGFASKQDLEEKSFLDVSAPVQYNGDASAERIEVYIQQALENSEIVFEWLHQRADGERWDAEVRLLKFFVEDKPFLQFSLADISERKRVANLQRIQHDLALELNSCDDLKRGLHEVLNAVLRFDYIDCGGIYVTDPQDQSLSLAVHHGLSPKFIALVNHVPASAHTAQLAAKGEAWYGAYSELYPQRDAIRDREGLRGFAMIPIIASGQLIALMNLASRSHDDIPESTRVALEIIAFQIGSSLLRLRTNEALHETEEVFQQFLDSSPVYVFFKDDQLRPFRLSANYKELIGRPAAECLGKTMHELFPAAFADQILADDRAVLEGGKVVAVDEDFNGRHYTTIKFPIHIAGKPRYLAGYTIDITARKRAERALKESTSQFQAFMDHAPSMTIIKDDQLRPLFFNKEFLAHFPSEEWLGKTPHEIFSPSVAETMEQADRRAIDKGLLVYEEQWADKSGAARVLETRKFVIPRGDLPPYLGAIITDITERKHSESLLLNAQKLESLGILAGGIAHDFNNLLGGLFGYVDLARTASTPQERDDYLANALMAMTRAQDLTRQLLTFAKGGTPIKKVENIDHLIENAVSFALSGSTIGAHFKISGDLWACECDRNQLSQVIDNIVINAVQAMPGGGNLDVEACNICMEIDGHAVLPAGDYVRISITDYGIGIPKEYIQRVFDPFFTTKPKGHGLGLATSYSIVNRHGGCIEVDSEPGRGSSFHVTLPAKRTGAGRCKTKERDHHVGHGQFIVMDDEDMMRRMTGRILESFGYQVVLVDNGGQAIDAYTHALQEGQLVAGMIFDLTIPGSMGGKEAIVEIRKLSATVPVFVTSGYADDPVMAKPEEYGFTGGIAKPFTARELSQLLNRSLGRRKS
jgi:PAS domain S-box-containing protein